MNWLTGAEVEWPLEPYYKQKEHLLSKHTQISHQIHNTLYFKIQELMFEGCYEQLCAQIEREVRRVVAKR